MRCWIGCITLVLLVVLGCNGQPPVEPVRHLSYTVEATSPNHDWEIYRCFVTAALVSMAGRVVAIDSVVLATNDTATLRLVVLAPGPYRAITTHQWEGQPGSRWLLTSEVQAETTKTTLPTTSVVRCI